MVDNAEEINVKESKNDQNSQKQIETAIKFLQNPRVQGTPLSQRKAFLVKKGLSEDEIQKALELSETADLNRDIVSRNQSQAVFPGHPQPYSLQWRDFFWVALIGGSFGYLLAHLVKTYLLPYILNQKDEGNEKIDNLQTSVCELKENLSQTVGGIQDTLDSVQKMLQDQQQKVQNMSLNLSTSQACLSQSMNESYSLTEIKSELSSLKGLLLNRRQFPSPVVQSSPFPSIPAWQRNDTQSSDETDVKNGNILQENTDIGTSLDNPECNANETDSSSETITIYPSSISSAQSACGEKTHSSQYDSSYSTMSSDDGSPNLSLNELKETLSDTYVKLPK